MGLSNLSPSHSLCPTTFSLPYLPRARGTPCLSPRRTQG